MKKKVKNLFTTIKSVVRKGTVGMLCLVLVGLFMVLSASAHAQTTIIDSGTCGANLTWVLTNDSTLTISGRGEMENYNMGVCISPPWYPYYNSISTVIIGDSVTSIGNYAFGGCINLNSVTIPNSITTIGNHAFRNCVSLISVALPNSITTIGDYAFMDCISLISVTIPNSATSIGFYAFGYCISLDAVTIGNSVVDIGDMAFDICRRLRSITVHAIIPPIIDYSTFHGVSDTIPVYIPCGTYDAYRTAWSYFSNFIEPTDTTQIVATIAQGKIYSQNGFNESVSGIYTQKLQNQFGCDSLVILDLTVAEVGIVNYELPNANYVIYPNPTTGKIIIRHSALDAEFPTNDEIAGQASKDGTVVEIFDVYGKFVLRHCEGDSPKQSINTTNGLLRSARNDGNEIVINISHLANGVYFLRITDKNQFKVTKKIVKE